jgi:glyoxylase I family protein
VYRGIEHLTLTAKDPEKLSTWYCDVLGFEEAYRSGGAIFLRHEGTCMIEVLEGSGGINVMLEGNQGGAIFAVLVDDLKAAVKDLAAKNVELLDKPMADRYCKIQFFLDGEGNLLHLIERRRPLAG